MPPSCPHATSSPYAAASPAMSPWRPRREAGWQRVTSCAVVTGSALGLPCYCSRLFSNREAAGASWLPPGWNSLAYFKPLAQGVQAAPAQIFSELYLSKRSTGRERGKAGAGVAAPGLFCRQQLTCAGGGCRMEHPPGTERSPNPTWSGHMEKLQDRASKPESEFKGQQIPV